MTILICVAAGVLFLIFMASQPLGRAPRLDNYSLDIVPDRPRPFGYKMAWLAVRTEDTAGLAECLGLRNARPANWDAGVGTVYDDKLGASLLYLAPPVKGWSFVIGLTLPHPVGPTFVDKLTPLLLSLGRRYPDVQYFFTYPLIDFFAWARVKDGRLVRAFAVNDEGVVWNKGRVTAEERALGLRLFEFRGVRERRGDTGGEIVFYPTEDHVLQIAGGWSLDPTAVDRLPSNRGCGLVASSPAVWRSERRRSKAA